MTSVFDRKLRWRGLAELSPSFVELGAAGADSLQLASHAELELISHIHTAGNSPALADAAALVLVGDKSMRLSGYKPRAKIMATTTVCGKPHRVCFQAAQRLLKN